MAFATNVEHIEFESADDWTFSSGLATHKVNVLAVPLGVQIEELMKYASGLRENEYTVTLEVELFPFLVSPSTSYPDTSDKIALLTFLKTNKPLRIKECTLERYETGGITDAKTLLESLHLTVTGVSTALDKEQALETMSLTLEATEAL
jgi:hypothetical protein